MQGSRFRLVLPFFTAILALGLVDVAAREWVATEQLGTVLQLTDDSWKEVERGSRFVDGAVIRTLQRGQLRLESGADRIGIGRDTVVEIVSPVGGVATSITQHAGGVTLEIRSGAPALQLLAPGISVAPTAGVVLVRVEGDTASVAVSEGGGAVVTDRGSGQTVTVASGGAVTGGGGTALAHVQPSQGRTQGGPPPGSGPGSEPGAAGVAGDAGGGPGHAGGSSGGGGGNAGENSGGGGGNAGGNPGGGNAGGNSGGSGLGPPPGFGQGN